MKKDKIRAHILQRLKSIPLSLAGYFKNSDEAIATAKQERNLFLAFFYPVIFFLSSCAMTAMVLSRLEGVIASPHTDMWLTIYVDIFTKSNVLLISLVMSFVFWFSYVTVRFFCVKIFTKKQKRVFKDSLIECGVHCIGLSLVNLIGALLCALIWWSFIPGFLFFSLFFFILLIRGVSEGVPEERRTLLFHLVVAFFAVFGFLLVAAGTVFGIGYISLSIISAVAQRAAELLVRFAENFMDHLAQRLGDLFGT